MGEETIYFYCKKCRKYTKVFYTLTGNKKILITNGVSIRCHTHKCTRVITLKNYTEGRLLDRSDSNGKCFV